MATRWAVQNGNWSNPATWNGGTLPAAGDDVYADGYTVTIDQDVNVGSLHTDARDGGTAGGTFTVSCASGQTRTITCTGAEPNVVAGPSHCITISSPPADATVRTYCSPKGGSSCYRYGIDKDSACVYRHEGNCYTGVVSYTPGLAIRYGFNNTIIGNAYAGNVGSVPHLASGAVSVSGGASAVMTGTVYGSNAFGAHVLNSATLTLNGNVYPQGSNAAAYLYNNARLIVNGNIYGHATNSAVAGCSANDSTNLLTLNGNAIAQAGPAISGNGLRVRANGGLYPSTSNYAVTNCALELNGTAYIASNGRLAFNNLSVFGISSSFDDGIKVRYYNAETNTLGDEDTLSTSTVYGSLYPAQSDVRHGVKYGPSDQYTGTAHIPDPGSVAKGVPVDNTVGTAVLTSSDVSAAVWDEPRSQHTTTGTYGAVSEWAGGGITPADIWSYATRTLTSAMNITSDGQAIDQARVANLDAAVSTRLAQSDIATIVTDIFANTIETGITFKNLCQVLGAVIAGCISTAGTDTEVFKAINNSGTTRVTVSVDEHGNRSNVVFTL